MNWDDPSERFALIERVGPEEYNRLFAAYQKESIVETVNGYPIRPVVSARWGQLWAVGGGTAYSTLDAARTAAQALPPNPEGQP